MSSIFTSTSSSSSSSSSRVGAYLAGRGRACARGFSSGRLGVTADYIDR